MRIERCITLKQRWSGGPGSSGVALTEIRIHPEGWEVWGTLDEEEWPMERLHAGPAPYQWRAVVATLASEEGGVDDPIEVEGADGLEARMLALVCGGVDHRSLARVLLELSDAQLERIASEAGDLKRGMVRVLDIRWAVDETDWEGRLGDLLPDDPDAEIPFLDQLQARAVALDEDVVVGDITTESRLVIGNGWPTTRRVDCLFEQGVNGAPRVVPSLTLRPPRGDRNGKEGG